MIKSLITFKVFWVESRKNDNKPFPAQSVYFLATGLQRHMKEFKPEFCLFDDPIFLQSKHVSNAQMIKLNKNRNLNSLLKMRKSSGTQKQTLCKKTRGIYKI